MKNGRIKTPKKWQQSGPKRVNCYVFRAKRARIGRICFALLLPSEFCKLLIKNAILLHDRGKKRDFGTFFIF
jgi:hypothetical protein